MKNFANKTLNHIASLRVTGALNREQKGRSLFVFHLACLLTVLLALPHCENDDNGGGGGEASLAAIYLWVTSCTVKGDMNGGTCPDPVGAPANGPARADAICANQYESDVSPDDRDRIAGEGEPRHTAMLVRSNDPPKEVFPVRGKDTLKIQRPDETLIADSWDQFFDPSVNTANDVTGSSVTYWTGWHSYAGQFTPVNSGGDWLYCGNAGDGAGAYWTVGTVFVFAKTAKGNAVNEERLYDAGSLVCDSNNIRILCIAH